MKVPLCLQAWIWGGAAFLVASLVVLNSGVIAALTFFSGAFLTLL